MSVYRLLDGHELILVTRHLVDARIAAVELCEPHILDDAGQEVLHVAGHKESARQ